MLNIRQLYRHLRDKSAPRLLFYKSIPCNATVLDIGCGSGAISKAVKLHQKAVIIYAVDLYKSPDLPSDISFCAIDIDLEKLPFPDSTFDVILFTHVIEHLRNPLFVASEIRRVLKQDGIIYLETPNWISTLVPSFGFCRKLHNPFNFYDDPTHVRPWTKQGVFEFLFQGCSCEVNKVGTVRNFYQFPVNILEIIKGVIKRDRSRIIPHFWNVYGWCIYAVGKRRK